MDHVGAPPPIPFHTGSDLRLASIFERPATQITRDPHFLLGECWGNRARTLVVTGVLKEEEEEEEEEEDLKEGKTREERRHTAFRHFT
ncbi:hypothetical protein E2C01_005563 [Portunus trituberculatus]|uniref:Uncharacterized protein n=1 Tax=Portunus trituberculatus TaxID=210409 RepID=A0A5B7CTW2_PORTR|nr:hypothetical protein [Portunus trituberculatus]